MTNNNKPKRHFVRSKWVSIFKVKSEKDKATWTHREFFRNIDDLVKFELGKKKTYIVIENIYQGPIIAAPESLLKVVV